MNFWNGAGEGTLQNKPPQNLEYLEKSHAS